ncbi:hypothetical protein LPJ66_001064 [Kickxella alabastrina]|uniref:Uncharacterized protein n=1 Tax=Kickxella alabastrina TaxID=61397 RepID=A0ACC1IU85_9FUNG|nr:hypothetical protein LPJ66_001064 [Kickxella alabastrina]
MARLIEHPDYATNSYENDIGLIILNDTVPDSVATKVKVYANNFFLEIPLEVAGFGFENLSNGMNTDELTKVDMKVGSDEYCKQIVEEYNYDYLICTESTVGKNF